MTLQLERSGCLALLLIFAWTAPPLCAAPPIDATIRTIEADREDEVSDRPRPGFDAIGLRYGRFYLYPAIGLTLSHDDNIFAQDADTRSDSFLSISPSLNASLSGSRHTLGLFARAELARYDELTTENYDDWNVTLNSVIELTQALQLRFLGNHTKEHEPRSSPDAADGKRPTTVTSSLFRVSMPYQPGMLFVTPLLDLSYYSYSDIEALVDGQSMDLKQDDRDNEVHEIGLDAGIVRGSTRRAYVHVAAFERDYDRRQRFTGYDRSSDGYEAGVGLMTDFGTITKANFYLGYRDQRYADPLVDIADPIFRVGAVWKPTEATSVGLTIDRIFAETTAPDFSGYVSTRTTLGIDHELVHNIILSTKIAESLDRYRGIGSADRKDRLYAGEVGLSWKLSRGLGLAFQYEYTQRSSSDNTIPPGLPDGDFVRHVSWFRVSLEH